MQCIRLLLWCFLVAALSLPSATGGTKLMDQEVSEHLNRRDLGDSVAGLQKEGVYTVRRLLQLEDSEVDAMVEKGFLSNTTGSGLKAELLKMLKVGEIYSTRCATHSGYLGVVRERILGLVQETVSQMCDEQYKDANRMKTVKMSNFDCHNL